MEVFSTIPSLSLDEINAVSLQNRFDSKFVIHGKHLTEFINSFESNYSLLHIGNSPWQHYETTYFDTPKMDMYFQHHNQYGKRVKMRIRNYLNNNKSYFEIKQKLYFKTKKLRFENVHNSLLEFSPLIADCNFLAGDLEPTLNNSFKRLTLVSVANKERITIDTDIEFTVGQNSIRLSDVAVVEVKTSKAIMVSTASKKLSQLGYQQQSFSKYCIGMALLSGVKCNMFKPALNYLDKLKK